MQPRATASQLLLLGLVSTAAACEDRVLLDLSVDGLWEEIQAVDVQLLAPQTSLPPKSVGRSLDSFLVRLPDGYSGRAALRIFGQRANGCAVADALGETN